MAEGKAYFRANDWWQGKAALLMGMVYLFAFWFRIPFPQLIKLSILSLLTISGFASLGYLLNDLFDLKKDALAGKPNSLQGKPVPVVILLFVIASALLLLPWLLLPWNHNSMFLIGAEIVLFLLYSVPPVRLKDRGFAGIVADAAYAHALPVLLAAYTFALAANYRLSGWPVAFLLLWQTLTGLRNILIHQFEDYSNDKKSGTNSYYQSLRPESFLAAIKLCITMETAIMFTLLVSLTQQHSFFILCPLVLLAFFVYGLTRFGIKGAAWLQIERWRYFPNEVYEKWIPSAILLVLSLNDIRFLWILLCHTLLFNIKIFAEAYNHLFIPSRDVSKSSAIKFRDQALKTGSAVVNNFIYYTFLLFGINLKKENLSAMQYLRKPKKTKQR